MARDIPDSTPADSLVGKVLEGEWMVREKIDDDVPKTGGYHSVGYLVENSNEETAFLKALDYTSAFETDDPARYLERLTKAFNYERDVLEVCNERGLNRVVVAITDGKLELDGASSAINTVQYIVFERADSDMRSWVYEDADYGYEWLFRALHQVATGIKQLHQVGIAHQDLKPSNILMFEDDSHKIGDLGKSVRKGERPPHYEEIIPGDRTYAPPELLYEEIHSDWNRRRRAYDLYLLGSLAVFLLTGMCTTALIKLYLKDEYSWLQWSGDYDSVLPYVREAYNEAMSRVRNSLNDQLAEDVMPFVRYLCDPDPDERGHPKDRIGYRDPYSVERFVTRFDVITSRARMGRYSK